MLNPEARSDVHARLNRISGQVAGIQKMVESDRYCVDVLTQVSAVRAALAKVSKLMLESHIQTCVAGAFESRDEADRAEKTAELVRIFEKNCSC